MANEIDNISKISDTSDLGYTLSVEESDDAAEIFPCDESEVDIPNLLTWPSLAWTGVKKKIAVLLFNAEVLVNPNCGQKAAGENYHLSFKMLKNECHLVRSILTGHGFHEVHPSSSDFNILWTGSHLKPYVLRGLFEFQKVNHFPRSYEVTRKDRLFKNIQRMQHVKGLKHFDFVPQTFVVPSEYQDFCAAVYKNKGIWIVKPAASSRGRGIYLVTDPSQVSVEENVVICRYIANPLLINGFKFDIRLYIAVTSFDPLIVYLFEEGLTRFATVKFNNNSKGIRNNCMHLTNYSVNKRSSDYVLNSDADVEDYGNKWSLGALLRYLRSQGIDTTALMMSIEDVIIKTLISVELPIASACKMFQPHRGNCFELFGFDILIDENLRPWILEVNLSPSLACDTPLDLKIKSNMISDLLSLIGLQCHDPTTSKSQTEGLWNPRVRLPIRARQNRAGLMVYPVNNVKRNFSPNFTSKNGSSDLTNNELRLLRCTKEEYSRRGGWVRIFPTPDTWDVYSSYLQYSTSLNHLLHLHLFNDGIKNASRLNAPHTTIMQRGIRLHGVHNPQMSNGSQNDPALLRAVQRSKQYERKLICLGRNMKQGKLTLNSGKRRAKSEGIKGRRTSLIQEAEIMKPDKRSRNSDDGLSQCLNSPAANLIEMLKNGLTMSKCQARFAFSTYLSCIKERLIVENGSLQRNELDVANEQMNLVIRFLQRAANNLQTPLKIVIPCSKLSLNERRQVLAEKLHEFIQVYNKETEDITENLDLLSPNLENDCNVLNDRLFHEFVVSATENELEEVLTVFTKMSKSASIFLRSSSESPKEQHLLRNRHETESNVKSHKLNWKRQQNSCRLQTTGTVPKQSRNFTKPLTRLLHKHADEEELGMDSRVVDGTDNSSAHLISDGKTNFKDVNWLLEEQNISSSLSDLKISTTQNGKELFHQNTASTFSPDYLQSQQNMIEESRALLEESKAKHQVLLAHALVIQKQLFTVKDQNYNSTQNCGLVASATLSSPTKPPSCDQNHHISRSHHFLKAISNGKKRHIENRI